MFISPFFVNQVKKCLLKSTTRSAQTDQPLISTSMNCISIPDQQGDPLLLNDSPVLTLEDLLGFSFQVSQAMDFLSSRNVSALTNHLSPLSGDTYCV